MGKQLDINESIVRGFARNGNLGNVGESAICQAINQYILRLLQHSLPAALELSRDLVKQSDNHSTRIKSESFRALARSEHLSGSYVEAVEYYIRARRLAGGNEVSKARIDRTLIDVYMYLGEFGKSRRRYRMAADVFGRLRDYSEIAKAEVNFANVLHRQDRHREASDFYSRALAHFKTVDDELSQARCMFNLANTAVQLFDFQRAEKLYDQAAEIYRRHGFEKDAVDADWGLAWMHMLQGKFHFALRELASCEEAYRKAGVKLRVASCVLDRAEVYLQLSLFMDSLECATIAEEMFKELKVRYESSKAALYKAYSASALGKRRTAQAALRRARTGFELDKNIGFLGAVSLLESKLAQKENVKSNLLAHASNLFSKAQIPLWQAYCDISAATDQSLSRQAIKRLAGNPAVEEIPAVYTAYQVLLGDLEAKSGSLEKATSHWKRAAKRLDAVRSLLPPIELRSAFGKDLRNPHQRLISTYATENPIEASIWLERYKTQGLWSPAPGFVESSPERQRVDQSLTELSEKISALSRKIFQKHARMETNDYSSSGLKLLSRNIREWFIEYESIQQKADPDDSHLKRQFQRISKSMPIVQIHVSSRDIISLVHYSGETKAHRLLHGKEKIERFCSQWSFLIESEASSNPDAKQENLEAENRLFRKLGEALWSPLDIPSNCRKILLIPEGDIASLPWPAFIVDGKPLVEKHQFVMTPSLRHHLNAKKVRSRSRKVSVFVGDTTNIENSTKESEMIKEQFGDSASVFDPCNRNSWPERGSWNIWHYSGHAQLNTNNPFYSSLSLADGAFFAADLRLRKVTLNLATIAACHSGTEAALPGEESTGFVRSFLEMGTRNVLASLWSVFDESSVLWMKNFYEEINSCKNAAEAAQSAAIVVREKYRSAYYWSVFAIFGAGK